MSTKIDLHIHSTASDGTDSPAEIIHKISSLLKENDTAVVALTDHDTTDGIDEFLDEAKKAGSVTAIPGIEISTDYHGTEVHVLGYGIDPHNPVLKDTLKILKDSRQNRSKLMAEKLNRDGFRISYDELFAAAQGTVSRPHIAKALMEKGYVSSIQEAFSKFLGSGKKYYVERYKITPTEAVHLILESGGLPVLAHIMLYTKLSAKEKEELAGKLKEAGLLGIETYYSTYSKEDTDFVQNIAIRFDLLKTGGSDYHGFIKPHINLFTGTGSLDVKEDILPPFLHTLQK